MSFRHRLALFLVITLAAVQIFTGLFAYAYLRESIVDKAKSELSAEAGIFTRQLNVLSERVAHDVKILSLDFALREAIAQQDYGTELSVLRNHGNRVGATRMLLVGMDGTISADTGTARQDRRFAFESLLEGAAESGQKAALARLDGQVYWVVTVPVRAPITIAFIAAFIPVDKALLAKLDSISSLPRSIALATEDGNGSWRIAARSGATRLEVPADMTGGMTGITQQDGREYLTVVARLATAKESKPVLAVMSYPLDEAFAAYRAIVIPVVLVLLLALALAVAGLMIVVRGMSRPLEILASHAGRIAAGDYSPPAKLKQRDEIGQLGDALGNMARSIAEREAALTSAIASADLARQEAVRANDAKSQFLANMSHELRTPLNAIVGFGEMLYSEVLGKLGVPRYREYAEDIVRSGQHLLGLVSRILHLAEVEAGKLALSQEKFSTRSLIEQASAMVRTIAEHGGVHVMTENRIPSSCESAGDVPKLRQALAGIIHNAVKFTPQGGTVGITAESNEEILHVVVWDSGMGMRPEEIDVVVKPFQRLRSALDGQHQGAGLGLPFAKAVLEAHGGHLVISSELGRGTRVEIILPLSAQHHERAA